MFAESLAFFSLLGIDFPNLSQKDSFFETFDKQTGSNQYEVDEFHILPSINFRTTINVQIFRMWTHEFY